MVGFRPPRVCATLFVCDAMPHTEKETPMPDLALPDGGRMHHVVTGEGPTVLFVHAGIADGRMWHPQVTALSATHRCVAPDLRGFGRSPLPDGLFAWRDDLIQLLTALGGEPAVLVGCSMGGGIAAEVALVRPDLVAGLVVIAANIPGWDLDSEELEEFDHLEEEMLEEEDFEEAVELNLETWVDGPKRDPGSVRAEIRDLVGLMQRAAFAVDEPDGVDVDRLDPPLGDRAAEIVVPTRVIVGELDFDEINANNARFAATVPDATLIEIDGAAHMLSMERPATVTAIVRELTGA